MDLRVAATKPLRNQLSSNGGDNTNRNTQDLNGVSSTSNQSNSFGNSAPAKTHFFTGSAERVLAWNRIFKRRCFFEVIASLISIQESDNFQDILLLKDKKGPILQVIRYSSHEMLEEDFTNGQILRCVGYMTGINTMTAVNIRKATSEEIATLKRHCYIGDFTISGLINAEDNQN